MEYCRPEVAYRFMQLYVQDIPALLDALDEMEAENERLKHLVTQAQNERDIISSSLMLAEGDRDRWREIASDYEQDCSTLVSELSSAEIMRDRWKVRSEKLREELIVRCACNMCIHSSTPKVNNINFIGQNICFDCITSKEGRINFELDEARFTGGDDA